jgi:hypothetical protein
MIHYSGILFGAATKGVAFSMKHPAETERINKEHQDWEENCLAPSLARMPESPGPFSTVFTPAGQSSLHS